MRGGLADADRSRVAVAHAPLIRRCGATFPQKGKAKKLLQPNTLRQHCAFQLHQGGGFFGVYHGSYFFAVRCCVVQHGILRCTGGQADRHIGQRIGVCAIAQAAPRNVVVLVLPQRKAQPVDCLVIGVILGTPDLQRMGIGVLIVIPQEEGVFRYRMAAPDHEIGHDRRVGTGGIGQTGGDTLAKHGVGTAYSTARHFGHQALPRAQRSSAASTASAIRPTP